ncbi:hypothetical protein HGO38_22865 [Rhizobium sp. CG5]|uniref:hypothetical protein n=1 Tax=Rhizobium sp. CG5 TaxID=2726076 RepID=UPI00203374A8|nr:hypothetical protein [Rhizobium sp. CG5]MCM2476310.1 hypothetical protein [Rhizobium sp. CG5]
MEKQVVKHGGMPVGIAVRDGNHYRFIAVKFHVIGLDESRFPSIRHLQNAIRDHLLSAPRAAA